MARYDKYEPLTGGFRAKLAVDWLDVNMNKIVPVSLDASGNVVVGTAGQSGFVGVVVLSGHEIVVGGGVYTGKRSAGDVVDVMQDGEIVEMTGLAAGTSYYAVASGNGVASTPNTTPKVGWTVEATRLIVRCNVTGDVIGTA